MGKKIMMTTCDACDTAISVEASKCPQCAHPHEPKSQVPKRIAWDIVKTFWALVLIWIVYVAFSG